MDVNRVLLQIAIKEKDFDSLTTDEMDELYQRAEHETLRKLEVLDGCEKAHLDKEEEERLREDRFKRAMSLIEEACEILSIYELELRTTKHGIKFVDRRGKMVYSDNRLVEGVDEDRMMPKGQAIPASAYYLPILEAIEERGGKAGSFLVFESIEEKMRDNFTEYDLVRYPSGGIRWKTTVYAARKRLKDKGYLSSASPQGVWKITEKGRKYLRDPSENG